MFIIALITIVGLLVGKGFFASLGIAFGCWFLGSVICGFIKGMTS